MAPPLVGSLVMVMRHVFPPQVSAVALPGAGHDLRDRDVAQQERVRKRRRDVRDALACAVAANKRPMNAH